MDSSGGRLNTCASISHHPRFSFYDSVSNLVSNDNNNEELNWGLFTFDNGVQSPNTPFSPSSFISTNPYQILDSPSFPFNSNIVSSPTTGSYSGFDLKEEKTDVSDFIFQSQTEPPTTSCISGNKMEESMKSQVLEWKVNSQPKQIDFSMEIRKIEPESVQSLQTHCSFDTIQATKEQGRHEDGYNWRKYGQKQVKGSKRPRSYFKCSYPNCPMRKKVEKDLNGYITEIVYKGKHCHPRPQNMNKSSSSNSFQDTILRHSVEKIGSRPFSKHSFGEDEDEQGTSNTELGNDDDYETEAKRWKLDDAISYVGSTPVQEPRVVIQTKSEIDILDDGYRWRKYGQKAVKGNPNPRSYYKCTSEGCPVRKLVERASNDWQAVITTYEAKHNHRVPMPRGGRGYAINQPPTSSNKDVPVTTMPLPNYSNNIHGMRGLTSDGDRTAHILQTFENSTNYGFF